MDGQDWIFDDRTPGVEDYEPSASYLSYTAGLGLAILATIASFIVAQTNLLWAPGIPVGLVVLAFAQIGIHLVFFLHLGSGPDHTNNILALAFGVLIVFLVITGSIWIIANLNANMMPMACTDRKAIMSHLGNSSRRLAELRSRYSPQAAPVPLLEHRT
jgi:cytochrome o ubiquinol oxidase operon protein cyoD